MQGLFKALSDPTRRKILELLKKESLSVADIHKHFDMTGATLSHHLKILKEADLITDNKKGTFIYYEINTSVLEDLTLWFNNLIKKGEENNEK